MCLTLTEMKGAVTFNCPGCNNTIFAVNLGVMCDYCQSILPDAEDLLLDVEARIDHYLQESYFLEF